ncbi:hypothetical protein LINGRAHAP2_LOCUS31553 [Linum grandiflorum]
MGGKKPKAVVTDGDLAMLNAIKEVFSEAVNHRCAWHIPKIFNPSILEKR